MKPIRLDQDVRSLSEFRAGMSAFIQQVTETGRPLLLTQNGRGIAVVLDVREFADVQEQVELLYDLAEAERGIAAGRVTPNAEVKDKILTELLARVSRQAVETSPDVRGSLRGIKTDVPREDDRV